MTQKKLVALEKIHKDIKELVERVGALMLSERLNILKGIGVGEKADKSKVTPIDNRVQKIYDLELPKIIYKHLGNNVVVTVIGEESKNKSKTIDATKDSDYLFIVDPLDGTWPYTLKGNVEYGTGIGLFKKQNGSEDLLFDPVSGIFFAPELEIIDGEIGSLFETCASINGSLLNNKEIKTSNSEDFSDKKATLQKSSRGDLFFLDDLKKAFGKPEILLAGSMAGKVKKFSPPASGLGRIVQVAASGNYPEKCNYLHTQRKPAIWDIHSGSSYIVEKAGGIVIHPNGESVFPFDLSAQISASTDDGFMDPKIDSVLVIPECARERILSILSRD